LEALFGAVFLDAGYDAARKFIEDAFGDRLHDLPDPRELRDPKTRLQEWLQARALGLPKYELANVSGEAHRQEFEVTCTVKSGKYQTSGNGRSRRNAEQAAAERMLVVLTESKQ
jgi:ribonuclease-3